MVDGMISHLMSFLLHSFRYGNIIPDVRLCHEKARRNIFLLQDIQHLLGISILIPAVKCQIDDFFILL